MITLRLALGGFVLAAAARGQTAEITPAWSAEAPDTILWLVDVPGPQPPTLLVATPRGLITLDARRGELGSHQPLISRSHIRPARRSAPDGVSSLPIVFDRHTLWALRPGTPTRLAWTFEEDALTAATHRGDPEVLSRWLDVVATPRRVLTVSSDGRVVWLEREAGRVLGRADLGLLATGRLEVGTDRVVVCWSRAGRAHFAFLNPDRPGRVAEPVAVEGNVTWTALVGSTLVALGPGRAAIVTADGARLAPPPALDRPIDASVCTWELSAATASQPGTVATAGLAVLRDNDVALLDVATGALHWSQPLAGLEPRAPATLRRLGSCLIVSQGEQRWRVTPGSDTPPSTWQRAGVLDAGLLRGVPCELAHAADGAALELWHVPQHTGEPLPTGPAARLRLPAEWPADEAGGVVWLEDGLIVISKARLACYRVHLQ